MQVVIDANVVVAMLIKPGKPIDIFFDSKLQIFAPDLLFEELDKNKEEIATKSRLTEDWFDLFYSILKRNIVIIPESEFIVQRRKAEGICPHPKDITYFALALHLGCAIWTNEKKLDSQNQIRIYATHELMGLL
jgi:predicted nucleic acid-binding protein